MSVALRGSLEDFGIAEVFQLIGQHCKTGVLELAGNGQKMHLAFENGSVVWAAPVGASYDAVLGEWLVRCGLLTPDKLSQLLNQGEVSARSLAVLAVSEEDIAQEEVQEIVDLLTRETIFEVLRWDGGSFDFSAQPVQHTQGPENVLGAEQILMDGLRMLDEWHTFEEAVPSEDIVFGSAERFDVFRQRASGYSKEGLVQAESVFQLVDGRLSVRRIMDLSRLGTFEATRILAELRKYGLIEPLDPRRVRSLRRRTRPSAQVAEQVRWGLENLSVTADRLKALGMEGFTKPVTVSCADHETGGPVIFQQWDGKKWSLISDWVPTMRDVVRPMIEAAAGAYAKENNITPRDCK